MILAALCIVPPIAFVAALRWLDRQPDDLVFLVSGITAAVVIVSSFALSILYDKTMDEWHRSNSRFSHYWGDAIGISLVALLLATSPFRNWIVATAGDWTNTPDPDSTLVLIAFTLGFGMTVVLKTACIALLSVGWGMWKSRGARDAA